MPEPSFWSQKRVLLTGHTGFKGAWLALWLERLGAHVHGFSLEPDTEPSLFGALQPGLNCASTIGDIRDRPAVIEAVEASRPQIVIHMAAQPLVRRSYREPVETFATNVMGTAHVLDALRPLDCLQAVLVITTDKVYRNLEDGKAFVEDDPLGSSDPYSSSKAATEFVVASWASSFFAGRNIPVVAARAGNVIGGGDWSEDRIVPDIWRAIRRDEPVVLRNPQATRPWQHVLEPLDGYLRYVEYALTAKDAAPPALNFGPYPSDVMTVADLTEAMLRSLHSNLGWKPGQGRTDHEMALLSLDPSRAASIGWRPRLSSEQTIAWTAEWYGAFFDGKSPLDLCHTQISRYEALS